MRTHWPINTSDIGGVIVAININSDGKLLGAPSSSDLETATVAFSNTLLDLEIIKRTGGQDVAGYELTKSINGGTEITVATSADLPMSLSYLTIDEYISGLGVAVDDLRIGDVTLPVCLSVNTITQEIYHSLPLNLVRCCRSTRWRHLFNSSNIC